MIWGYQNCSSKFAPIESSSANSENPAPLPNEPPPENNKIVKNLIYVANRIKNTIDYFQVNVADGKLSKVGSISISGGVAPLRFHPTGKFLYAALETNQAVATFSVDPSNGVLTYLNEVVVSFVPTYLSLDLLGNYIFAVAYGLNRVVSYPILANGHVATAPSSVQSTISRPHSIVAGRDFNFVYVPNTGADTILKYALDSSTGILDFNVNSPGGDAESGDGPRHLVIHPTLNLLYVVNETSDSISAFSVNAQSGELVQLQKISTLPDNFDGLNNDCADIHITPDGKFVYASNRGHDSIAMFSADPQTGLLTSLGQQSTEARPREFVIGPSGKYLFVAGQDTGRLASYEILIDGRLEPIEIIELGGGSTWVEALELIIE